MSAVLTTKESLLDVLSHAVTEEILFKFPLDSELVFTTAEPKGLHLPFVEHMIINPLVCVLGILLNSIILKVYFKEKSDLALYIKCFASLDIFNLLLSTSVRYSVLLLEPAPWKRYFRHSLDIYTGFTMLGALFLALDRFLVVVFPHKFQLYEKKMRIFKVVLFVFASSSVVGLFFDDFYAVGGLIVSLNLLLHLVGCLVLYSIIVARVFLNDRKMNKHRHVGNKR